MVAGRHGEAGTRRCPGNVWAGELCSGCVSLHVCPNPPNTRKWRGCQLGALVTTSVRADSLLMTGHCLAGTLSDRGCARGLGGCGNSLYFPANFAVNLRLLLETGYKTQKKVLRKEAEGRKGCPSSPGGRGEPWGFQRPLVPAQSTTLRAVARPWGAACHRGWCPLLWRSWSTWSRRADGMRAQAASHPACSCSSAQQPRGHGLGQGTQRSSAERR